MLIASSLADVQRLLPARPATGGLVLILAIILLIAKEILQHSGQGRFYRVLDMMALPLVLGALFVLFHQFAVEF